MIRCCLCIAVAMLCCLLTFATSAVAATAWVVWLDFLNFDPAGTATAAGTVPMTGAESKADCLTLLKAVIRDKIAGVEARTTSAHVGDRYTVVVTNPDGSKRQFSYTYLPPRHRGPA